MSDYAKARRHLMRVDPVLGGLVKQVGACGLHVTRYENPFEALVEAIVWQQLSGKAAATIYGRVLATFESETCPPPDRWLSTNDATLRAAGLSFGKISFVKDLAARVTDGRLDLTAFDHLDDEQAIAQLTQVKGIGRWTAEMFLLFRLQRLDVFPIADVGIMRAIEKLYRLRKTPTPERMTKIAEPWRPYRSVATWYLWRSLDQTPVGKEK